MHPVVFAVILLFALLGHGYFWIGIVNRLHGWAGPHRLIDFLTLACLALFLILPAVVIWQCWANGTAFLTGHTLPPVGTASRVYVLMMVFFGLGNLLAKIVGGWSEDDPGTVISKERQTVPIPPSAGRYLRHGAYAKLLNLVPFNQVLRLSVDTKRIAISNLPPQLAGYRIVHISDLHLTGRIAKEWFVHMADTVNSLDADAVIVTGDLIEKESCRPWLEDILGVLRAKDGIYFVLGNHDFYVDADRTVADLTRLGLQYVGGESQLVLWNGYPVLIAGNEVPWRQKLPDLTHFDYQQPQPFRVLMMHTPDQFDWACSARAQLAFAGHTHGGQVCFPILGAVASPSFHGTRFACGTFKRGNTVMHVTRGISGETPMRWLCPPEIALLELVAV